MYIHLNNRVCSLSLPPPFPFPFPSYHHLRIPFLRRSVVQLCLACGEIIKGDIQRIHEEQLRVKGVNKAINGASPVSAEGPRRRMRS